MKPDRIFVKAATTKVAASKSQGDIRKLLTRYGASAISVAEDLTRGEITVSFVVPDTGRSNAAQVPVRLPISVGSVYRALYPLDRQPNNARREQAERVAWRNLVLWLDAALSAATMGLQTITEAFFAHTVVGDGGVRMIEMVEAHQGQLGAGTQRLLTAQPAVST